ncbi:formylglycine-generating enzyme family protein [Treponema socranskii]
MGYSVNGIGFLMKVIKAVTDKTIGHNDESKNQPHTVSLSAYLIGETEVTQELWQAVMGNNPSYFNGDPNDINKQPAWGEVQEKRPVEKVNWYACIAFCNKLSKACNLEPCYTVSGVNFDTLTFDAIPTSQDSDWDNAVCDWSKNGFRLPTDAEWEWAAMGGTSDKWAGTDTESELEDYAWYGDVSPITHEVKKKKANGYGLYDMSGNVEEWCWDWYTSDTPAGGQDPTGGTKPDSPPYNRTLRGGYCYDITFFWSDADAAAHCTRAWRNREGPSYSQSRFGLRLVCRPD